MISALVTTISLNLTYALITSYGVVAGTLPVTGATTTTPIQVTSTAHGVPIGRVLHGIVTNVTGEVEANGLWVLTPTDADHFALSTFDAQGNLVTSVGVNVYAGGGQIQYAFPDYEILLGLRLANLASAVATPRVVMVPCVGRAWMFEPYVGQGPAPMQGGGNPEQVAMLVEPQVMTEPVTFQVFVSGCATPPSPDFGDLDATQLVYHALVAVLVDMVGHARVRVLNPSWPSQDASTAAAMMQRGQQWSAIIELQQPVTRPPQGLAPKGTTIVFTVQPTNPLIPTDQTTITVSP